MSVHRLRSTKFYGNKSPPSLPAILLFDKTWLQKLQNSMKNFLFDFWFTQKKKRKIWCRFCRFSRLYENKCLFSVEVEYFKHSSLVLLKSIFSSFFRSLISKLSFLTIFVIYLVQQWVLEVWPWWNQKPFITHLWSWDTCRLAVD